MKLLPVNEILERIGILACGIMVIVVFLFFIRFIEWVLNMMSFKREVEFDISALQGKSRHHDDSLDEIKNRLEEIKEYLRITRQYAQNESLDYKALYLEAKEKADNRDRARMIFDNEGHLFFKNEEGKITATFTENTWTFNEMPKMGIYSTDGSEDFILRGAKKADE